MTDNQNKTSAMDIANKLVNEGVFSNNTEALTAIARRFGDKQLPIDADTDTINTTLDRVAQELIV